jgi:hypothetical protein
MTMSTKWQTCKRRQFFLVLWFVFFQSNSHAPPQVALLKVELEKFDDEAKIIVQNRNLSEVSLLNQLTHIMTGNRRLWEELCQSMGHDVSPATVKRHRA